MSCVHRARHRLCLAWYDALPGCTQLRRSSIPHAENTSVPGACRGIHLFVSPRLQGHPSQGTPTQWSTALGLTAPLPHLLKFWRAASTSAKDVRPGMIVEDGGQLLSVVKAVHTPGIARQGGNVQLEYMNAKTGAKSSAKVSPSTMLQLADVEKRKMQLLYRDDEGVHLMDPASFDQITIELSLFEAGGKSKWIKDGLDVDVAFHNGSALSVDIPTSVTVTITDTPEDRISEAGAKKAAVCDTGATLMVPSFVQNGEAVIVNTVTGEFVRRASS